MITRKLGGYGCCCVIRKLIKSCISFYAKSQEDCIYTDWGFIKNLPDLGVINEMSSVTRLCVKQDMREWSMCDTNLSRGLEPERGGDLS